MKRIIVTALGLVLLAPAAAMAHRLDEYLQAARVSLERDRISIDLDLTPGARIASDIIAMVDLDRDGTISPAEARSYGQVVLSRIVLKVDGRPVALTLNRVEAPSIGEMREGTGVIQLVADARVETLGAGRREVYFQNDHHPDSSVYLVNALVPRDRDVGVVGQIRDQRQQTARIEYDVNPQWTARVLLLVLGMAGLAGLTVARKAALI